MKMKNISQRYNINRPKSRHGHKCSKYKKCLRMMMFLYNKNIRSSIHVKVMQHWGWVEKRGCL